MKPRANSESLGCCPETNFTIKDKRLLVGFLERVPFLIPLSLALSHQGRGDSKIDRDIEIPSSQR